VLSLNSGVKGNHRSEAAKIKVVNLAALNSPPGPHEHTPCPVTDYVQLNKIPKHINSNRKMHRTQFEKLNPYVYCNQAGLRGRISKFKLQKHFAGSSTRDNLS
jgi:hypothetical protein